MIAQAETEIDVAVAVLGGGLAGLTAAIALAQAGFSVACIDRDPPATSGADIRTTALAPASRDLLTALGVWEPLEGRVGAIRAVRVADSGSPLYLHFLDSERPGAGTEALGWIVENGDLRRALLRGAAGCDRLRHLAPASATGFRSIPGRTRIELADGRTVTARLVVGADGRESAARAWAGVPVRRWGYGQSAIVCTIEHERPHQGIAVEHFLKGGPFAVLPMAGDRASIVWSERSDLVPGYLALPDDAFLDEIGRRAGDWLGGLRLAAGPVAWPLSIQLATSLIGPRLALIGEAAHAIHPVAGQGLNLGLRDVAVLVEVLAGAARAGLDIGDEGVLAAYHRRRFPDTMAMAAVCDGLVRLFSNDVAPLRLVRSLGLAVVGRIPPLKRLILAQAAGTAGGGLRRLRKETA